MVIKDDDDRPPYDDDDDDDDDDDVWCMNDGCGDDDYNYIFE